jgi:acetoin utilization protein AcuB
MELMRKEHVRRFPVVDASGELVGIVSETDLLNASPSDATSLNVWEINYLMSKITVGRVMSKDVLTVSEDTPIEIAARMMADKKIGGLPVVRDGQVVGIITETDLFRIFTELLGARTKGLRLTAQVVDRPGRLAELASAISATGADIVALVTFSGENPANGTVVVKLTDVDKDVLTKAVAPVVVKIDDLRDCC